MIVFQSLFDKSGFCFPNFGCSCVPQAFKLVFEFHVISVTVEGRKGFVPAGDQLQDLSIDPSLTSLFNSDGFVGGYLVNSLREEG